MKFLSKLRRVRWIYSGRRKIKKQICALTIDEKLKLVVGSGGTSYPGWIATDLPHFDITKESDWIYFFLKHKIDNLLAEHVLEHLAEQEVRNVMEFSFRFVRHGGNFRIAVPDGYNRDPLYIDNVSPSGRLGSIYGHKFLWNYRSLGRIASSAGWKTSILEYFDEDGIFVSNSFSLDNGLIERSSRGTSVNPELSLLIDCAKE